jgi:hypothetical protein
VLMAPLTRPALPWGQPSRAYSDISNNRLNRILSRAQKGSGTPNPQHNHISTVSPFINKTL